MERTGLTSKAIINWGGEEVFSQALALCRAGDVRDVRYDAATRMISGRVVHPDGSDILTGLELLPNGDMRSRCPCYASQRQGRVCAHAVAVAVAKSLMEAEEEELARQAEAAAAEPEHDYIEVPAAPVFSATVFGSRASLAVEIDAHYGVIDFPACSVQADRTVYLEDPDDDLVRRVRSIDAEEAAIRTVKAWGFAPGYREGDQRLYITDPQKVLTFLGAGVPALRRKGWVVELEGRLADMADALPSVVPVVEVRDAPNGDFDVCISFDAGKEDISPAEVQAAVNRGDGYILRDGRVVLLDTAALAAAGDVFRDCATTQNGASAGWFRVRGIYAPYVKASLDGLGDCIDLIDARAPRWRGVATVQNGRNADAKFEPVSLGDLETVLRPYQKQGVYWLRFLEEAGLSGLLADEMGLGKTLQTLTWISLPRSDGGPKAPALIVCPTSLVRNWEAESAKFTPWLKTLVISGPDRAALFPEIATADVVVTSYALLQRDLEAAYLGRPFSVVVLDEAQRIKNRDTKSAKAAKMLDARRRLVLTGTPVENSVADVWSIFDFLTPGYLGEYDAFRVAFEDPIREGGDGADEVLSRLRRKLHPFILRRLKKSVAKDLPDKIVKVSYCPMSDDAQREYSTALAATRAQAGGAIRAKGFAKSKFEILAMLMKLRQIASRAKVEPFMEQLLAAVEGGHKILVFSQFVTMLKTLSERLREEGVPFCYLDGSTRDRLGECNRFNRTKEIPVFLISLMAGGTGLNLTGADMVMHYDPWWNPAVEDQATDRAHRIGQKKTVYVMKMIAAGSIEEKVLAMQRRKQAVIAATVTTTDAAVMERLTAADLEELLS